MFGKQPRSVDSMVEDQIRIWRAKQKDRRKEEPPAAPPVVTVSREFGAQGAAIGAKAAEELGFELWDQELVHAIAERSGASERLVQTLDEHSRSALEDLLDHVLMGRAATEHDYLRQLHRVLRTIEKHGAAVIIGRGAQYALDPQRALRVRVVAPLDQRIAGYAEREGLTVAAARAKVEAVEKDRKAFLKRYFDADCDDPHRYDLVLNSASFTVAQAARVVVAAYKVRFG